jgi:hypothetical protein
VSARTRMKIAWKKWRMLEARKRITQYYKPLRDGADWGSRRSSMNQN